MRRNKKIGIFIIVALIAVLAYGGVKLTEPSYSLTMDVNPSIEIVSNRLDKVVEVNPLNDDARQMLKGFEIKDNDLTDTIEDLADLMVLTGYISGGEDNLVMITVNDGKASQEVLSKVNQAIAAYLENKQIEAMIVNQSIPEDVDFDNNGKYVVAEKIGDLDNDLDFNTLASMTLRELIEFAESKDIEPEKLFTNLIRTKGMDTTTVAKVDDKAEVTKAEDKSNETSLIGEAKAKEIALAKTGGGTIVEFELGRDDGRPEYEIEIKHNGYEYELEIDGYTGKILEFERDKEDNKSSTKSETKPAAKEEPKAVASKPAASKPATTKPAAKPAKKQESSSSKSTLIGAAKAKEIALAKTGGGTVVELELDWDDGRPEYEIEIKGNGYEYELEIHGYTGKILDFERDKDDDYKKSARKTSPKKETSNKQTLIGEAKAKEIALAKSGGGRIVEFELDWDDGVPEYEIEIKKDGYEYEIEIHGYTGKILDFEMEKDD